MWWMFVWLALADGPDERLRLAVDVGDLYLAQEALDAGADAQLGVDEALVACDGPLVELLVATGARPAGSAARRPLQCDEAVALRLAADAAWGAAMVREAAREGRRPLLEALLGSGARAGPDALQAALQRRQEASVHLLLDHGVEVDAATVAVAARAGDVGVVERLLRRLDASARGEALVLSAGTAPGPVRALLAAGAPVNHVQGSRGPALVEAAAGARLEVVRLLLRSGAEVDLPRHDGRTALMVAGRDAQVVAELLAAGADPRARLPTGWTVLHEAARQSPEAVRALIEAGAAVDAELASSGERPLHQAARAGNAVVVELLLAAGADPSAVTRRPDGEDRAVDLARAGGHTAVVELFEGLGDDGLQPAAKRSEEAGVPR